MRKTGGNFLFHRLFGWKALFWASAWWLVAVLSSYLLWNNLPATPFVLFFPAAAIVTIRSGPWYGAATGGAALIFALLRSEHLLAIFPGCLTMVLGCLVIVWLISAVQKRNQFLSEQAELLERIAVGQSVELVLPALTESISRLNRTAKACVILADDSQRHLADCLTASLPLQFAASLRGLSIETVGVGTCATAIKEGREAACQDIVHSTEWSGLWRESCLEYGVRACHSFPVFSSAGKAVASFFMCYSRAHKSTRWERKLASFGVRLTSIVLERDRATKALAESEQRFRSLADTIPQIAWMANPDGQIFWLNQRWYQYTGSTAENDKSLDWKRAQDPRMFPRVSANYELAIRSGVAWEDTFPLRQHDGKMRSHLFRAVPFRNQSGEIVLWFATGTDISNRDRDFRALHALVGTLEEFVLVLDLAGRIAYANLPFQGFWLKTPVQTLGKSLAEIGYPENLADRFVTQMAEVIRTGQPFKGECVLRNPTGQSGYFEYIFVPLINSDGSIEAIGSAWRNVTVQRETVAAREALLSSERAARTELERVSRMKDEFLATLSHELRTPLNAILGWSHLLRSESGLTKNQLNGVEIIERNARAQMQLIDDLLDTSRIINGKIQLQMQSVNLSEVIGQAIEAVRPSADSKGLQIFTRLNPTAGEMLISGDPVRIEQAIWNLLTNAVKFTPPRGRISVRLDHSDSQVEIHVADTGRGIKAEFLPFVFDRFRQEDSAANRRYGGLGLGLAIVKQVVELHGGSVRVDSLGDDKGSTFTICLPVTQPRDRIDSGPKILPSSGNEPLLSVSDQNNLFGLIVLIVDDDSDARTLTERILSEAGASVLTAASAESGLFTIRTARPDILIADLGMPVIDGYELIKRVRTLPANEGRETPALALTAFVRPEDQERALAAGFQLHLRKPLNPAELVRACSSLARISRSPAFAK